jgi:hypothetical protein
MSDLIDTTPSSSRPTHSRDGQSLVEFALVLPLLLVLLLGIADFGRVFAAGITIEAAARDGAEAASQEYIQRKRADPTPLDPLAAADYDAIRAVAHTVACEEAMSLPNQAGSGSTCSMPITAVCIHDGSDTDCGNTSSAIPDDCSGLVGGWTSAIEQSTGTPPFLPYVEVRICYEFTTLFNLTDLDLPFGASLSVGETWLQKDRTFVAADY